LLEQIMIITRVNSSNKPQRNCTMVHSLVQSVAYPRSVFCSAIHNQPDTPLLKHQIQL